MHPGPLLCLQPSNSPIPNSVILISPSNQVLLLHRVQSSSAFPSAHVFPGGNVSPAHDGPVPAEGEPGRHEDSPAYRLAAIRETFEESGILLAREKSGSGRLLELSDSVREEGRRDVHAERVLFPTWLAQHNGIADTGKLLLAAGHRSKQIRADEYQITSSPSPGG